MEKSSLEKVLDKVYQLVDDKSIPIIDRAELLINLMCFLNPEEYEDNIKILKKHKQKGKND